MITARRNGNLAVLTYPRAVVFIERTLMVSDPSLYGGPSIAGRERVALYCTGRTLAVEPERDRWKVIDTVVSGGELDATGARELTVYEYSSTGAPDSGDARWFTIDGEEIYLQ